MALRTIRPRLRTIDTRTAKPPPKRAEAFYLSREWRTLIASIIAKRGRRCEECGTSGGIIYGDHIIELKDGGAPLDEANIMLRCPACHGRKTAAERTRRLAARHLPDL